MLAQQIVDTVSGYIPLSDFATSQSVKALDDEAAYVSNTVDAVRNVCSSEAQRRLKLDISSSLLIADSDSYSDSDSSSKSADDNGLQLVKQLAEAARSSAPAHACSSVLAGHASESDEYADIGILLGAGTVSIDSSTSSPEENARAILSSLGLVALLSTKITLLPLSEETGAPIAFKASAQDTDVKHLASLLTQLSHRFAFSATLNSTAFHFLLGQLPGSDAWAGLLGVGTWSDYE